MNTRAPTASDLFFESAPDLLWVLGSDDRFQQINSLWPQVLGFSKSELQSQPWLTWIHPEDRDVCQAQIQRARDHHHSVSFEGRFRCQDGSYRWLAWKAAPLGQGNQICGRAEDITQQREAAHQRSKQQDYLTALVELQQRLLALKPKGRLLSYALEPLGQISGASRVYIFQNSQDPNGTIFMNQLAEWVADQVPAEIDNPLLQRLAYEPFFPGWIDRLSQESEVNAIVSTLPDSSRTILASQGIQAILVLPLVVNGEWWGFIGFDNCAAAQPWDPAEIELLKAAAAAISLALEHHQTEARYRSIFESASEGIYQISRDGYYLSANPALAQILGYESPIELMANLTRIGQQLHLHLSRWQELIDLLDQQGSVTQFESQVFRRDGEVIWISENARAVQDHEGQLLYYEGFVEDITARKQSEDALRQSQTWLQLALEGARMGVWNWDLITDLEQWSPEVESLFGLDPLPQRSRQDVLALVHPADRQRVQQNQAKALNEGTEYYDEYRICLPNGEIRWIASRGNFLRDNFGQPVRLVGMNMDITERKRSEANLQQSLALLQATFDSTADGILAIDCEGQVTTFNRRFVDMWNLSEVDMAQILTPSDQSQSIVNLLQQRVKDPSTFQQRIAEIQMQPEAESYDLIELDNGSIFEHYAKPQSVGNMIIGQVWSYRDITATKKVERLKNEFVSTVSHELRTPLTSIRGSLGLVLGGVTGKLPAEAKAMIEIAYKNSERLATLINDILDIDKIESGQMRFALKSLNLFSLVQAVIEDNQSYAQQYNVQFKLIPEVCPTPLWVYADNTRLAQVMINLLSNAAKFSPPHQTVTIQVRRRQQWIRVEVMDQGPGIPTEFRDQVFQKFAQADSSDTRQKGGTGLGLSISKAIIDRLGGRIGFETELDQGTTFYFELPEYPP